MKLHRLLPALCFLTVAASEGAVWDLDSAGKGEKAIKVRGRAQVAPGAVGRSLVLDGSALIELQDSAGLNGGAEGFTFSVWFNPYALHAGQQVIAGKNRYALGERQWSLTVEDDGTLRAHLRQDGWSVITGREPLNAGSWHHAVLTVGSDRAVLYLNGKSVGEVPLKKPVAATAAPITLGGIHDGGRVRQPLQGAVDAVRFEPRFMEAAEIAAAYQPVSATHEIPKPWTSDVPLWDEKVALPAAAGLPVPEGVEFHVIKKHEPGVDGYPWLHGVGLAWHKGKLYASFGHNRGAENTASEEARGRVSSDGGRTWNDVFTIDTGTDAEDLAVSHGVFLSHGDQLWAFHGAFRGKMGGIHTRAYVLEETSGRWEPKGVVVEEGFWALNQPVRTGDGRWIMPGICAGVLDHGHEPRRGGHQPRRRPDEVGPGEDPHAAGTEALG